MYEDESRKRKQKKSVLRRARRELEGLEEVRCCQTLQKTQENEMNPKNTFLSRFLHLFSLTQTIVNPINIS